MELARWSLRSSLLSHPRLSQFPTTGADTMICVGSVMDPSDALAPAVSLDSRVCTALSSGMRIRVWKCIAVAAGITATIFGCVWGYKWRARQAIVRGNSMAVNSTLASVNARPYSYRVPADMDPDKSHPLVIALHGLGGRGVGFEQYFRIDRLVDEMGFLAAFPDGTEQGPPGRRQRFWNATDTCCNFESSSVDDVAYLDDVISDMSARFHVDPKRVFFVGHSNGGYMSYRFACDRASRVAAIVSSAGSMWNDASRCKPSEPVAVLEVHGTDDAIVPYDGGRLSGTNTPLKSVHATVSDWTQFNRCAPGPEIGDAPLDLVRDEQPSIGAETTIEKWSGCRGVELWTVRGGIHSPHFRQPDFARAIGRWMLAHPKP